MSTPESGIAYLTMFKSSATGLTDGVQFSGVFVAPDEILTAAHCVTEANGGFRDYGDAFPGYLGTSTGATSLSIAGIHVLDDAHTGPETDAQVASDFALIHLSRSASDAQVFLMGDGTAGGDVTISGYPTSAGGRLVEVAEHVSPTNTVGELTGGLITPGADAHGASGGPVWRTVNGTPTVEGLISAETTAGAQVIKALTATDVAQINAWITGDHAAGVAVAAATQTPAVPSIPPATPPVAMAPAPPTTPPVAVASAVPTDRLDEIAQQLDGLAQASSGRSAGVMRDVADAIGMVRADGASGADLANAASRLADTLKETSWTPQRAIGFEAGLLAAEGGASRHDVVGYVTGVFSVGVTTPIERQAVMNGFTADATLIASGHGASGVG